MVYSFAAFTIFTMICAVAPNWGSFLFFRLATGVNASSPIAVIGGVYADTYGNPVARGRAMAVFIGVSTKFLFSTVLLRGYESIKAKLNKDIQFIVPDSVNDCCSRIDRYFSSS